jgi:hypothetical protein
MWTINKPKNHCSTSNRPNDGFVIVRAMEDNGADRVDYMERIIIPQDLRDRDGSFTSSNRTEWFNELDGDFNTDEVNLEYGIWNCGNIKYILFHFAGWTHSRQHSQSNFNH